MLQRPAAVTMLQNLLYSSSGRKQQSSARRGFEARLYITYNETTNVAVNNQHQKANL